jgi:uncharacterized protein (DUF2267 family)
MDALQEAVFAGEMEDLHSQIQDDCDPLFKRVPNGIGM